MVKCVECLKLDDKMRSLIHIRCGAHVINLAVTAMLENLGIDIENVRNIAKKVSFQLKKLSLYRLTYVRN